MARCWQPSRHSGHLQPSGRSSVPCACKGSCGLAPGGGVFRELPFARSLGCECDSGSGVWTDRGLWRPWVSVGRECSLHVASLPSAEILGEACPVVYLPSPPIL